MRVEARYIKFRELFDVMHYPAGEPHVEAREGVTIQTGDVIEAADVRNFDDLGIIVTADEILSRNGAEVTWFIPYFPFGRHDRRRSHRDGLELEIAMQLVANMDVVTLDPHSDVLGQMRHFTQTAFVQSMVDRFAFTPSDFAVVIPDAGATKKAYDWIPLLDPAVVVQASKTRDPRTGALSGFKLEHPEKLTNRYVLVVDDICDGGGTFLGLHTMIEQAGASHIVLAITHGLFTKGTRDLYRAFNEIWAAGEPLDGVVTGVSYESIYRRGVVQ